MRHYTVRMCQFITAVAPPNAAQALAPLAQRHGLAWRTQRNERLSEQVPAGSTLWLTTAGHCDCDSFLGRLSGTDEATDTAAQAQRLRRKGVPAARIERILQQQAQQAGQAAQRQQHLAEQAAGSAELSRWRDFLRDALQQAAWLGVVIHHYSGDFDEAFVLAEPQQHALAATDEATLMALQPDCLHQFHAR